MNEQVRLADAVAERDDLQRVAPQADSLVAVLPEDQWLAVFEHELMIGFDILVGEMGEGAVVEDVAVLEDLDEGGAGVLIRTPNHLLQMFGFDVDTACDKSAVSSQSKRYGIERMIQRTERGGLGDFPLLGCRGVLAFRQSVDAIVEEQNVDVEVATQHVNEVIAADRERIAVSGCHPNREF